MDLRLQDPFAAELPEVVDAFLEEGSPTTCRFNRWGTLLAVGCHDGRVAVWDFETLACTRLLAAHVQPVTSLSWSRCGRLLASSAADRTVVVWDVLAGTAVAVARFASAVLSAQFHPRDASRVLVCPLHEPPCVLAGDFAAGNVSQQHQRTPLPAADPSLLPTPTTTPPAASPPPAAAAGGASSKRGGGSGSSSEMHAGIVAAFDRRGRRIFVGGRGTLHVVDTARNEVVRVERIPASSESVLVKAIEVSRNGKWLLVSCSDRVVRCLDATTLACVSTFHDDVDNQHWRKCTFSANSEYVVGALVSDRHDIYVYARDSGALVKTIKGPQSERVLDIAWHPIRPKIVSCSTGGTVVVWATFTAETWSAYAPTFKEIEENEEYVEREDEFDWHDEDTPEELQRRRLQEKAERIRALENSVVDVDVVTTERVMAYVSGSEEEGEAEEDMEAEHTHRNLHHLPTVPERDVLFLSTDQPLPAQIQQQQPLAAELSATTTHI